LGTHPQENQLRRNSFHEEDFMISIGSKSSNTTVKYMNKSST